MRSRESRDRRDGINTTWTKAKVGRRSDGGTREGAIHFRMAHWPLHTPVHECFLDNGQSGPACGHRPRQEAGTEADRKTSETDRSTAPSQRQAPQPRSRERYFIGYWRVSVGYASLPKPSYLENWDSMSVKVSGSSPSVFQTVIAYWSPSLPSRRKFSQDHRRSIRFFLATRSSCGQISQNCRAPDAFSSLRRLSFAAAVGRPNGVNSPFSCLQASMSRTSTIRCVVIYSLLDVFPPNPEKTVLGRILRQGEITSKSQPSTTLRISSPERVIRFPSEEYTLLKPSKSPARTTEWELSVDSKSGHQEQGWYGRIL